MFELRKIVTITENTYREGGRPQARLGGLTKDNIIGDGLR